MMPELKMKPIAVIRTDFPEKFGIPRQSGLIDGLRGTIVFEPEYRNPEALRGLEDFSHIWLIWLFSAAVRNEFKPTVRPPRLGGNRKMGVFATRSPFRPNPIGLSLVRLESIEEKDNLGMVLNVRGADIMDGTPILDIKPYLPLTEAVPDARGGFSTAAAEHSLEVCFPKELLCRIPEDLRSAAIAVLENDPRPAYQNDGRIYGVSFAGFNISFCVREQQLTVLSVEISDK